MIIERNNNGTHKPVVDIIWNITLVCPWNCSVCCVDAVHVSRQNGHINLHSSGLQVKESIRATKDGSIYDQAMAFRQQQGLELSYEEKIKVLDNLSGVTPKIDFSGGDPLSASENLKVMQLASSRFGRKQITLTATGAGLAKCNPNEIAHMIGELNFTYDSVTTTASKNRPAGYASGNLKKAAQFKQAGVKTRGECPLTIRNLKKQQLEKLYLNLHDHGIDKLLIMRLFPVGRGTFRQEDIPNIEQYRQAIDILRELETKYGNPTLKLQCALKWLVDKGISNNPCDVVEESFGLTANGTLLASPWAINHMGKPLDESWVLGNLAQTPMTRLLSSDKANEFVKRKNENFGHCKIFAYFNSKRVEKFDRIFDASDPLYTSKSPELLAPLPIEK